MGKDLSPRAAVPTKSLRRHLLFYHEIPSWQRDNEYLLSGYRPTSGSWLLSFKSVFAWHNESVNIHSHAIGSALFAYLPWHFYTNTYRTVDDTEPVDALLVSMYLLGVAVCFACSACCHIIWNLSAPAASFGNRLDFCGILLLMWGASLPSIHLAFDCDPVLKYWHWGLVSISACGCITFTLHPRFLGPSFRKYRALLYTCFGLSAITFVSHGILKYGFDIQRKRLAIEWMALMGLLNIVGAIVYASRLPERWFPYRFDFVGASHQIFHVLVLAAGLAHYKALACGLGEVRRNGSLC
ncbi:hypothetical protein M409DRAFT_30350 [Zasmidium cellare ATCC 36951]|uniref:MPR-typeG-protein-coupled receptor n=1 Tax=Zasmidium cellare ATCC 36951 TaxID=1080233 RepID=A0A6A6BWL8_ZASCE|nr:uncharacterized protein M409DRAFT_30350 [Zasmidium cellare ATCC 36951]KAF2159211.1 hypothetical protein M409DRAFT_30350 [Zasmidium cellare ATCC 36951]